MSMIALVMVMSVCDRGRIAAWLVVQEAIVLPIELNPQHFWEREQQLGARIGD